MMFVLILLAVAVFTEAGVLHQPGIGIGLHYQPGNSHAVRPARVIRTHIAPPLRSSIALNSQYFHEPLKGTILTSNTHAVPISHAPIGPSFISTRIIHPSDTISNGALTSVVSPTVLSSSLFTPSLANSHASPPLVLNTAPKSNNVISFAPTITHIPPPTVVSPVPISVPTTALHSSQIAFNPGASANYEIVHEVQEIQQLPEKSVSYTISENDYKYLKQQKAEGDDLPYHSEHETSSTNEKHQNTHHEKDKEPSVEAENVLKRNVALIDSYKQGYSESSVLTVPEPVVNKHIYFHVPPPDFDEPEPVQIKLPAPKKTYNIVFIKVPSQEQQNYVYLQHLLQARQTQTEDKTLIYVLSKKQEPPQVVLPSKPTSSPAVFFVKYRTRPGDLSEIKNDFIEDDTLLENISPILERKRRLGDNQTVKPKKL